MTEKQPQVRSTVEALRLADDLDRNCEMGWPDYDTQMGAAAELRRLHEVNQQLTTVNEKLLYTSSPSLSLAQRQAQSADTWVGLTQQDIDIAFDDTQEGGGFDDFARAIEAKLKAKNSP